MDQKGHLIDQKGLKLVLLDQKYLFFSGFFLSRIGGYFHLLLVGGGRRQTSWRGLHQTADVHHDLLLQGLQALQVLQVHLSTLPDIHFPLVAHVSL